MSIDQIAARDIGKHTQLASLELALERRDIAGACDAGTAARYTQHHLLAAAPTTPLPMENNPRVVFERLFGDDGSTDAAARLRAISQSDRSMLDSVTERSRISARGLGPRDRLKLDEYLDAVRDIERRIQKAEEQSATASCRSSRSRPAFRQDFEEHAKLMFDLQVLAYQSDLTRVITFMIGTRVQRPHLSARSASPRRTTRCRTIRTIRRRSRSWPKINTLPRDAVRLLSREAAVDRRTATARCSIICCCSTAPA